MTDKEMIFRLAVAAILGAAIGVEREYFGKAAGFRTHALVCFASALIMVISVHMFEAFRGQVQIDPSRIPAQVVSGIGFLGAGTIIRYGASVRGLTTAATLWAVSGIGLACGTGYLRAALAGTVIVFIILFVFAQVEEALVKGKRGKTE